MKLIIDISEGTKEQIIALTNLGESFPPKLQERIVRAIINGTSLDNIRAEIVEIRSKQNVGVLECLDIIDKYRGE